MIEKMHIAVVGANLCIDCGKCEDECPMVQFACFKSIKDPEVRARCIGCGDCISVCPVDAIRIREMGEPIPAGRLPTKEEMFNVIQFRRSVRGFKDQEVPRKILKQLANGVCYGPTGHNEGYLEVMFIDDTRIRSVLSNIGMAFWEKTAKLLQVPIVNLILKPMVGEHAHRAFSNVASCYPQQELKYKQGKRDYILFNAPVVALILGPKDATMGPAEGNMAAMILALYALSFGLGTCISGIIMALASSGNKELRTLLNLPADTTILSALMLGYPKNKRLRVPPRPDASVHFNGYDETL